MIALRIRFLSFLISRYLDLTERHFLSDILVPFPDSSDLYIRVLLVKLPQIQFYLSIAFGPTFFRKSWNSIGAPIMLLKTCDSFVPQLCRIDMSRWVSLAL